MQRSLHETLRAATEKDECPGCHDTIVVCGDGQFALVALPCRCPEPDPSPG